MKKYVLFSLILVLSLSSCGSQPQESVAESTPSQNEMTQTPKTSVPETSIPAVTEPVPESGTPSETSGNSEKTNSAAENTLPDTPLGKAAAGGQLLSEAELKEWEAFFAPRLFCYLLISYYTDPAGIDLFELLHNGIYTADSQLPLSPVMEEKETALLNERFPQTNNYPGPISKLPVEEINALLEQYFGILLEQTEKIGLDRFMVLPEYDSYYTMPDGGLTVIQLIEGAKMPDGRMLFHWEIPDYSEPNRTDHDGIVCLQQDNGRWMIRSNERIR